MKRALAVDEKSKSKKQQMNWTLRGAHMLLQHGPKSLQRSGARLPRLVPTVSRSGCLTPDFLTLSRMGEPIENNAVSFAIRLGLSLAMLLI